MAVVILTHHFIYACCIIYYFVRLFLIGNDGKLRYFDSYTERWKCQSANIQMQYWSCFFLFIYTETPYLAKINYEFFASPKNPLFNTCYIFSPEHSGFRSEYICVTTLSNVIDEMLLVELMSSWITHKRLTDREYTDRNRAYITWTII